jgi:hypothetical protein
MEMFFLSQLPKIKVERKEKASMYTLKSGMIPSFILILIGSLDCVTTVIGVMYYGASELNPFLTDIVHTNIWAFLVLKVSATFVIALTYVMANRLLKSTTNKDTKSFQYSSKLLKVAYGGLVIFLVTVVANNLLILLF